MQDKPILGRPNTLNTKTVSVSLPQKLIDKIDLLSASRSETIRQALEEYCRPSRTSAAQKRITSQLEGLTSKLMHAQDEALKQVLKKLGVDIEDSEELGNVNITIQNSLDKPPRYGVAYKDKIIEFEMGLKSDLKEPSITWVFETK